MSRLTVGSLFSGIGGLELGLERAGMRTVWQVEKDDYCRHVLAKHWPDVQRFDDVCTVGAHNLSPVDLICGGFPCQDISYAGKGAGLSGARSGLWYEFARVIREMGPRYVLVENVAALLTRGIDAVLGTLASLGYDAEWSIVSACAMGAPHTRERLFVVAYTDTDQRGASGAHPHQGWPAGLSLGSRGTPGRTHSWWTTEPGMDSMVYGVSGVVDRVAPLGNAVVPQVAECIGRLIVEHAAQTLEAVA